MMDFKIYKVIVPGIPEAKYYITLETEDLELIELLGLDWDSQEGCWRTALLSREEVTASIEELKHRGLHGGLDLLIDDTWFYRTSSSDS